MLYSSVWTRVPSATTASMMGWIVFCCTLASMRMTSCPPRWIRPRTGGVRRGAPNPSPACRGPALPPACGGVPSAPFRNGGRLALVPGHDVDLIDLHFACQCHLRGFGHQAAAQLLRHGLHSRGAEAEL